jgi:DDE superfamily endonuclease/Helix-turn-helix of DDE superfamily endonuclease
MNLTHLNHYPPEKLHALFGLTLSALGALLAKVLPELLHRRQAERIGRPDRQRAVGGGRRRRLKPYQEVLLTLIYLRHNVAHAVVGEVFGVSTDTAENTFHEVVFVLRDVCPAQRWDAEKRWKKTEPSWTPDEVERVLIDSFESPVRRPSLPERQKRVDSGKQKRHTLKSQVVTDTKGEILDLDPGQRGPTADKRLYEQSTVEEHYPNAQKQGDLAYQGIAGVRVPHKKPKGERLTEEQRAENRRLATVRVHVEHGIRRIKGWRILRDDYRIALGLFPLIASAVVGLVQLVRIVG